MYSERKYTICELYARVYDPDTQVTIREPIQNITTLDLNAPADLGPFSLSCYVRVNAIPTAQHKDCVVRAFSYPVCAPPSLPIYCFELFCPLTSGWLPPTQLFVQL